ncbi:MAG: GntR family transcriptional regulator [Kiritimatiellae bacterium]|nr:GntR family transcriptional regulator [Kiritimatiellia bacterium]
MPKGRKGAVSRYGGICAALQERIRAGYAGRLSEAAIMAEFGVGRNTAMRALDMLEAEGWVRRVHGSGTYPVPGGVKPRKGIHVVFTDGMLGHLRQGGMTAYLLFSRLQGILAWPQAAQCLVKIVIVRLDESQAAKRETLLGLGPRSGLIFPVYEGFEDLIELCRRERMPYVAAAPPGCAVNSVGLDHYAGTAKVMEHLVNQARRRHVLFVTQSLDSPWLQPRYAAYRDVLRANRLPLREELVLTMGGSGNTSAAAARVAAVLRAQPQIDAIFASSGRHFSSIAEAVRRLRLKVPERLALVVYDDPPELAEHRPPVTAVRTPLEKMGEIMIEKVVEMIDFGFRDDLRIVLEGELVVRASS